LSDAGEFEVIASNNDGQAKSSAAAEVDEKPSIVKGLIPADLNEGDEHVFRVEVSAPVRVVKWYRNGEELKPSKAIEFKQVTPKKYEILLPSVKGDDAGEYKVVLSNKAGECDSSAALTVQKPNVLKLISGLKDVEIEQGQPLEMSCKIEGIPKTVTWFKNGAEIGAADGRIKLIANESTGEYGIRIDDSIPSDGAAYRVVFANDRGEIFSGAVAHVKAKKEESKGQPAMFLSPLQDTTIPVGETLTLKCQVSGDPMPTSVKFYRNGVELKPDDRLAIRLALDGTATLRLRDAQKSDAGDFKVNSLIFI
jgi:hypothetical protein